MLYSTNLLSVDRLLAALILSLEDAFPGRIRSYYLQGSHADGNAVETSDIDVTVVFKETFLSESERRKARTLIKNIATHIDLDVTFEEEASLFIQTDPSLKLASQLLYGEEIRDQLPLMSIESWTRDRMHTSYWRLAKLFDRPLPLHAPLTYPNPDDEFYGYVRRPVQLENGDEIMSTRDIMRSIGWMATALVALQARRYIARKTDLYKVYQQEMNDRWGVFIEEIFRRCKIEWEYKIPDNRESLRDLCSRVLSFENHFLSLYRGYLLQELSRDDESSLRHLLWLLEQVPWYDVEIMEAENDARHRLALSQL